MSVLSPDFIEFDLSVTYFAEIFITVALTNLPPETPDRSLTLAPGRPPREFPGPLPKNSRAQRLNRC